MSKLESNTKAVLIKMLLDEQAKTAKLEKQLGEKVETTEMTYIEHLEIAHKLCTRVPICKKIRRVLLCV